MDTQQRARLAHIRMGDVVRYVNKDGGIAVGTVRGWKTDGGKPRLLLRNHGELVRLDAVLARLRPGTIEMVFE